jgi:hypothetical protein
MVPVNPILGSVKLSNKFYDVNRCQYILFLKGLFWVVGEIQPLFFHKSSPEWTPWSYPKILSYSVSNLPIYILNQKLFPKKNLILQTFINRGYRISPRKYLLREGVWSRRTNKRLTNGKNSCAGLPLSFWSFTELSENKPAKYVASSSVWRSSVWRR